MSSAKWRPFCLGLNVLKGEYGAQSKAASRAIPIVTLRGAP